MNSIGKTGGEGNADGFSLNERKREDAVNRSQVRVSPASCCHGDAGMEEEENSCWRRQLQTRGWCSNPVRRIKASTFKSLVNKIPEKKKKKQISSFWRITLHRVY